jgi:ADP-heptose:LPS heptosyltransferase/lauroyl/myristoyl acyltransferase
VRFLAWLIGILFYHAVPGRRRLILSNLHHAFPEKSAEWRRAIARECIRRFAETGLYSLAAPFLSPGRIRGIVRPAPSLQAVFAAHRAAPHPLIMCTPHLAHWETQTTLSLLVDGPFPEFASIYRPIDHPSADEFIKRTRERFGMRLLARTQGFQEILRLLRRRGMVGILYDQNAGTQGALTLLFDRVCSTTELPGLLAAKCGAALHVIYPRYLGFWQVELNVEAIACDGTTEGATLALNRWLENFVRSGDNACASWLWGHQRWKNQDAPPVRFRLEQKRNFLDAERRRRGLAALPRQTRLWIRLPNWLGDVVMALPLLRAIRAGRPDAEITLVAKSQFLPLLEKLGVADRLLPLPARGAGYFAHFWRRRHDYPDCHLLFTNSIRGDLEAWLTRCPQRFGIARAGQWRPLLTHAFVPSADFDEAQHHQFELWTDFLKHFGLAVAPDRTPFRLSTLDPRPTARAPIGLIAGSENNPEKRWPVPHWRRLIESFPDEQFVLLGTANDRAITDAVAAGFGDRAQNLAGRTTLLEFAAALQSCHLLVANDTGGMHLANALGVPLLGLFGPTNPVRTGPIFTTPHRLLQPPGCAPTGGRALAELPPGMVVAALREMFASTRS